MPIEKLKSILNKERIAILGFGREGSSTYKFIRKIFPSKSIAIFDADTRVSSNPVLFGDENCKCFSGIDYLNELKNYNYVIKSPGIALNLIDHTGFEGELTSQTDIFLSCYGNQTIGFTGTKGKSTTSSLMAHILSLSGKHILFAGNIGVPVFNIVEEISPDTIIVFEMSSHQLESTKHAPHWGVLLNLYQEHLDHYKDYAHYQRAKMNITLGQNGNDFFIYNGDNEVVLKNVAENNLRATLLPFSFNEPQGIGCFIHNHIIHIVLPDGDSFMYPASFDRHLQGSHNLMNIAIVLYISKMLKLSDNIIFDAIASFNPLPHRLTYLGKRGGKNFYNDSIATIPEATMEAVKALPSVDTLILGGFDRGIDYAPFMNFLKESYIKNIVFTGPAGKRMHELIQEGRNQKQFLFINQFDDAISEAIKRTPLGGTCLLSPAAASYGEFNSFEERGAQFQNLIELLTK